MSNKQRAYVFIASALLVLVGVRLLLGFEPVSRAFDSVFGPLTRRVTQLTLGAPATPGSSAAELKLAQLTDENARLRDELGFAGRLPYETIAADVTRKRVVGPRKFVVINRGSADGVQPGSPAVSQGVLVGIITSVDRSSAEVQLVTDAQFRATVRVLGDSVQGVVTSEYGSVILDLVPTNLKAGQAIETDGVDEVFPPGLTIGTVGNSIGGGDSIFKRYTIRLPFNPSQLDSVLIISGEE